MKKPKLSQGVLDLSAEFRRIASEELIPRHGRLKEAQIHQHSDGSLYTEADLAAEKALKKAAKKIFPDAMAIGEEEISKKPEKFQSLSTKRDIWIFDPIDGTGAFKRGEDTYGMMGAFIRNNRTQAGIIYTPSYDMMILAERGKGCWLYKNGNVRKMTISDRPSTLKGLASVAFACRNQDGKFEKILAEGVGGYVERNNASFDYTKFLLGIVDANFYSEGQTPSGHGKCPPWDHAAGVLAVQEAGGYAALPYSREGKKYEPLALHDRLLVASSKMLFEDIYDHIEGRAPELLKPSRS